MKKSTKILIGTLVLLIVGTGVYVGLKTNKSNDVVFCTMDAKMCPDGSFVGRIAPDCEFAECPSAPEIESDFYKNGVITANNPGQKPDTMYLIYEEPGKPALSKELIIDSQSVCLAPNGSSKCISISAPLEVSFSGKRVYVSGLEQGEKVLVRELGVLE